MPQVWTKNKLASKTLLGSRKVGHAILNFSKIRYHILNSSILVG